MLRYSDQKLMISVWSSELSTAPITNLDGEVEDIVRME